MNIPDNATTDLIEIDDLSVEDDPVNTPANP